MSQQFASDNNAGLCPEALEALLRSNGEGHVAGYGDDAWTAQACDKIRALFETDCPVFFVFSGTAANALALATSAAPITRLSPMRKATWQRTRPAPPVSSAVAPRR